MTDSSDVAAKAREALEGITPGRWKAYPSEAQWGASYVEYEAQPHDDAREQRHADFIAAAPELVAGLLAALETAETTNAHFPHAARSIYRAARIISGTEVAPEDPYHFVNDLVDLAELFEKAGGVS